MPARETLPLQHEIASSLAASIARAPPAPPCLARLAPDLDRGIFALINTPAGRGALDELRVALFSPPGREREALALWQESVATAAYAELLCGVSGASTAVAALGALLHRLGDLWMLRSLASAEARAGARFDALARARVSSRDTETSATRLLREWKLSSAVADCVTAWRRCGELEPVSLEAVAIYCGRLLALELLQPQFCVPGSIEPALAEHGFDANCVARVRASDLKVLRLIRSLE
jgi:hypothetical protein